MHLLRPALAFLLCSGFVHASAIIMQSLDAPLGMQQQLWIDEAGTNTQLFWAGGINGTVDGHARVFWCVQLFVDISLGQTYTTVVDFADNANLQGGWHGWCRTTPRASPLKARSRRSNLASWDIIEDSGDDFTFPERLLSRRTKSTEPTRTC